MNQIMKNPDGMRKTQVDAQEQDLQEMVHSAKKLAEWSPKAELSAGD